MENDGIEDLSYVSRIYVQNEKDSATFFFSFLSSAKHHRSPMFTDWAFFSDGRLINHPLIDLFVGLSNTIV